MKAQDDKNPFASKFQDFGAVPSDTVWKGIEAALPEKKKKRILAWWWWTSGMAASLLLCGIVLFETKTEGISAEKKSASDLTIDEHSKRKEKDFGNNSSNSRPEALVGFQSGNTKKSRTPILNEREVADIVVKTPDEISWRKDEKNENFSDLNERSVILLPKPIDLFQDHSMIEQHSWLDTTAHDKSEKSWWAGITVEQSNRFATKSQDAPEPPAYSLSDGIAGGGSYYWNRIQSLQLTAGFDWRKWSVGTGLEYSRFDRMKETENNVFPRPGQSFGIPVFATYRFYSNRLFSLGAQLDFRPRYVSYLTDSLVYTEVTSSPSNSPQSFTSTEFKGFQTQIGLGLCIDVPLYSRFRWSTVVGYQYSGYKSNDLRYVLNGSWLGIKTGILMHF